MWRLRSIFSFVLFVVWCVCGYAAPNSKIIVGIGQPLLDYHMQAVPADVDLGDEEHRCIDVKTCNEMACLSFDDERPGGIVFNTLSLLKQQLDNRVRDVYDVQLVGSVGRDGVPFLNHLTKRDLTWKGKTIDGVTARCFIFKNDGKRSMAIFHGAGKDIDMDHTKSLLEQDNIMMCILDGFFLSQDAPFDRTELVDSVCESLSRDRILFLLPSKEFIAHNGPAFFLDIMKRFGQSSGNWSEYRAAFGVDHDTLLDELTQFASTHQVTLRVTQGSKGSYTVTSTKVYKHNAEKPSKIQDTTGAGDAYVAGFELERLQGHSIEACGKTGALMAAHVIQGTLSF